MVNPNTVLAVQSHAHLADILGEYGISTADWGRGDTRTTADLYHELQAGESALFVAASGLHTYATTVKVNVFYQDRAGLYRLVEAAQNNFLAGTWRHRGLVNSLSEKRHAMRGETPYQAARRALREEIGIEDPLAVKQTAEIIHPPKMEYNYNPMPVVNETHYFQASLRGEDYDPRGYIEEQPTKRTFFHWETVRDESIIQIPLE